MKKILFALLVFMSIGMVAKAQHYTTGVGFRLGYYNGVSVKHFMNPPQGAIEGVFTTRDGGFQITGLYEHHMGFFDVPNMEWYFGVGGSLNVVNNRDYVGLGVVGVLGVEYAFDAAPFSVGLDWMPYVPIVNGSGFGGDGGGLTVRYTF